MRFQVDKLNVRCSSDVYELGILYDVANSELKHNWALGLLGS